MEASVSIGLACVVQNGGCPRPRRLQGGFRCCSKLGVCGVIELFSVQLLARKFLGAKLCLVMQIGTTVMGEGVFYFPHMKNQ